MLALPAPEDASTSVTLDVSTGESVTLDHMGPVVVNTDGTLSRITNWHRMSDEEQCVAKRKIAKRNVERLKVFAARGELKSELVSALGPNDGRERQTEVTDEVGRALQQSVQQMSEAPAGATAALPAVAEEESSRE